MPSEKEKVVAIIRRNQEGTWERALTVQTKEGDEVLLLRSTKGLVAVVGEVRDEDDPAISRLLEEIEGGR